jgi:hypothetical protein
MEKNKFHLLDIFMSVETPRISKLRNIFTWDYKRACVGQKWQSLIGGSLLPVDCPIQGFNYMYYQCFNVII